MGKRGPTPGDPEPEDLCEWNDGVLCREKERCEKCGWRPGVAIERKQKERQKYDNK